MATLAIAIGAFLLYILAYNTYGRWLGNKVFQLSSKNLVPSRELEDGQDYVPTKKGIVFGHHFTSIAGTGPIVGPAVAVMWGWMPALIWVLVGSIFIGAVHDFGALVVSMRNNGQTVGDIAGRVLSSRVRILFLLILVMALTIVLAIFGLVIAVVFRMFPEAIIPCLIQIPLAFAIGLFVHRKGANILIPSLIALVVMYFSVVFGDIGVLSTINQWFAAFPVMTWVSVLLVYSYIASVLPVWSLLQPRDYINSLQLISALGLVLVGVVVAGVAGGAAVDGVRPALEIVAPAIESEAVEKGLPLMFPFLFVTIACGAVSGFHCLVSSGTSSKQLECETDARFVGYGSMLTEGFLAVLVILACVAGLGLGLQKDGQTLLGSAAWNAQYVDFASSKSLGAKVGAFVTGASNFLKSLGLSDGFSKALMGVFVASFAATTLDTACRLQRYVVQELFGSIIDIKNRKRSLEEKKVLRQRSVFTNKHFVTIFAIAAAWWMASLPAVPGASNLFGKPGSGGMILWPLFGAINQLLAGLAFIVVVFWMRRKGMKTWFVLIPAVFMLVFPAWAMSYQIFSAKGWLFGEKPNILLGSIGIATLVLEVWMLIEAFVGWGKIDKQKAPIQELSDDSESGPAFPVDGNCC